MLVTRQVLLWLVDHRLLLSLLFCRGAPLRAAARCSSSLLDLVRALRRRLSRPAVTISLAVSANCIHRSSVSCGSGTPGFGSRTPRDAVCLSTGVFA